MFIIASCVILTLSPVGTKNNIVKGRERIAYRKKAVIIWVIETVIMAVGICVGQRVVSEGIILAMVVLSISQLVELVKSGRYKMFGNKYYEK